jgi:DNA-binding LacI/PurR family transcriptional regulator
LCQRQRTFSNTIAVLDGQSEVDLTCEHTESWTARIVHGMRIEASVNGIDLLLLNEGLAMASLRDKLDRVKNKIDGLITFPFTDNDTLFGLFDQCGIPAVTINKPSADARHNYVAADYLRAVKWVGSLFARHPAKRCGLLQPK